MLDMAKNFRNGSWLQGVRAEAVLTPRTCDAHGWSKYAEYAIRVQISLHVVDEADAY